MRYIPVNARHQLLAGGTKVGASGRGGIIAVACSRRAAVKILVSGKVLSDERRAGDLAVGDDQLSIGLRAQKEVPEGGDCQRIQDAEQHRGQDGKADSDL